MNDNSTQYAQEDINYVASLKDENLRDALLHQMRLNGIMKTGIDCDKEYQDKKRTQNLIRALNEYLYVGAVKSHALQARELLKKLSEQYSEFTEQFEKLRP